MSLVSKPPPRQTESVTVTGQSVDTMDSRIAHAINEIAGTYSDTVSVESKAKSLVKFGRRSTLGTSFATVWEATNANETYVSTNAIDTISSSSASDTGTVTVEGHTISGSDLTFAVQAATLNGQNKVVLGTPLARATRIFNTDSSDWVGDIYVYQDDTLTGGVPNTAAKIHLKGTGVPRNQSEKCSTAISSVDYMLVTTLFGSVSSKTNAIVEFEFQIRESGGVFRTRAPGFSAAEDSGGVSMMLDPLLIVPSNADCRMIAKSSASNTEVEAGFGGYLAIVV